MILRINDKVSMKINEWCVQVPNVEWSGALFYHVASGNIFEDDCIIETDDIFVRDVGSAGYTEFEDNAEEFAYQAENNLLDSYVGLIHSHNHMATFFSGTDTSTLKSEGSKMPHFLSLIVNNKGDRCARITAKKISTTEEYFTINGTLTRRQYDNIIDWKDLVVEEETTVRPFREEVLRRYAEIMKNKPTPQIKWPKAGVDITRDISEIEKDYSEVPYGDTLFSARDYELEDGFDFEPYMQCLHDIISDGDWTMTEEDAWQNIDSTYGVEYNTEEDVLAAVKDNVNTYVKSNGCDEEDIQMMLSRLKSQDYKNSEVIRDIINVLENYEK